MSKFYDFEQIKLDNPIEQVAHRLGLETKEANGQLRGVCPACKSGGPRALAITPARSSFYCFAASKGGDAISLVAHIRDIPMKDAAAWLDSSSTVPEERPKETEKLQPLTLEADHEAVLAVGFDPKVAEALGIGYAGKGLMRGLVAIPVRDSHGILHGYVGITEAKLPKDFQPPDNVVPLKRKA